MHLIEKIKRNKERKEFLKRSKKHLEGSLNGLRWWFPEEMLNLYDIPQEVRYPQCEFLFGKSWVRYLKCEELEGVGIVHYLEILKEDYKED